MATLRLRIKGEPKNISLRAFLSGIDNSFKILDDLDSALSGEPRGSLDWIVTGLSMGSLTIEVESRSRLEDKNFGPDVAKAFVTGLDQIERLGTTPPYLSEYGMGRVRQLVKLIGREGTAALELTHLSQTVEISAQASANIDQLIGVRRRSVGSVEGKLEMISIHGPPRFIVYHGLTRKAVTCKFPLEKMLALVKDALGRHVSVVGMVLSNLKGEPVRVELERIRVLRREDELPTTAEISGSDVDFTGDMSTEEFIRGIRGG